MRSKKNIGVYIIIIIIGLVIGSFIGEVLSKNKLLTFLNYGRELGINIDKPLTINLHVIKVSFAAMLNINIAGIIGCIILLYIFRKI